MRDKLGDRQTPCLDCQGLMYVRDGHWTSGPSTICTHKHLNEFRGCVELANIACKSLRGAPVLGDLEDPMCNHGHRHSMHRYPIGEPPPVEEGAVLCACKSTVMSSRTIVRHITFCIFSHVLISSLDHALSLSFVLSF